MSAALVLANESRPNLTVGHRPMAIVPTSMDEAYRLGKAIVMSGMAPRGMDTPEKCMIAIMRGMEVGLTPMQAVDKIAVVNGRPTIWGDGAMGLVRGSGLCEWVKETTDGVGDARTATCLVKRRGEPDSISRSFSVADAKKAQLWGKSGPWQQFPDRMLQMRARAFALRDLFADVLGGLYLREEIEDDRPQRDARATEPPPAPALPAPSAALAIAPPAPPAPSAPPLATQSVAEAPVTEASTATFREGEMAAGVIHEPGTNGVDPEALLAEIVDHYATAPTDAVCDEIDALYADDMDSLSKQQREAVQDAAEKARQRVAKAAPPKVTEGAEPAQEAAPAAYVDPFDIPESFASEAEYGLWLERAIAFTTRPEDVARLTAAWKATAKKRSAVCSTDGMKRMRDSVEIHLDRIAPKSAEPAPANEVDLSKPATTANEYIAQTQQVLKTFDGLKAYQWWLDGSDLRDTFDPPLEHDWRSKAKIQFVKVRNAAQDAAGTRD